MSAASDKLLGKVVVNDPLNSITKEFAINYLDDNRIGFAVTGAISSTSGVSTVYSALDHNLNTITGLGISEAGTGYGAGIVTTLYNLSLSGGDGSGATANVTVSAAGTITAVQIVDGGGAYGVGNTLSVPTGTGGVLRINSINDNIGDVIQVVGIGTTQNRNNSGYNGLYKITDVPSSKSVTYTAGTNPGIYTTSSGIFYVVDEALPISTVTGVAVTTLAGIVTVTTTSTTVFRLVTESRSLELLDLLLILTMLTSSLRKKSVSLVSPSDQLLVSPQLQSDLQKFISMVLVHLVKTLLSRVRRSAEVC